jgi:hypothetical protein
MFLLGESYKIVVVNPCLIRYNEGTILLVLESGLNQQYE